jgi:hypothetical protein
MGKYRMGEINEIGDIFTNLCAENYMVIGGTSFQHKRIHKISWVSPDCRTQNHTDYITINRK